MTSRWTSPARRTAGALTVLSLLVAGLAAGPVPAARAAASSGTACGQVSAYGPAHSAQTLAGSVPVLFVHGTNSGPGIWTDGADPLGSQVARIPGATSWAFDYSAASLQWVTDPRTGPALATAISCLAQESGHSVIVVAHSMGGLATQYAVSQPDPDGGTVADHVAEVVTIGTPFEGSALLTAAQLGILAVEALDTRYKHPALATVTLGLEVYLSSCAELVPGTFHLSCGFLSLLKSPVGSALGYESPEIRALPVWPSQLPVLPTAGDIDDDQVAVGSRTFTPEYGDVAVTKASAIAHDTAGAAPVVAFCHNVAFSGMLGSPCFHSNLVNNPTIDSAVRAVVRDHAKPPPTGGSNVTVLRLAAGVRVEDTALGPDGRLWVLTSKGASPPDSVQVVDPTTHAVTVDPLNYGGPPGTITYGTTMAFDGDGDLWLPATFRSDSGPNADPPRDLLVKYPQAGRPTAYSLPGDCLPGSEQAALAAAGDGAIWLTCSSKANPSAAAIVRLTSDDATTSAHVVLQGKPGDLIHLGSEELASDGVGPLAPAAAGTMWGLPGTSGGGAGEVEFRPDGSERLHLPPGGGTARPGHPVVDTPIQIVGNGSSDPVEFGTCLVDTGAVALQNKQCFISLTSSGDAESIRTLLADYGGYNTQQTAAAAMDRNGDCWTWLNGTAGGLAKIGRYYVRSDAGGGTTVFPFSVPSTADPSQQATLGVRAPVITPDGGLWTDGTDGSTAILVGVLPRD